MGVDRKRISQQCNCSVAEGILSSDASRKPTLGPEALDNKRENNRHQRFIKYIFLT